MDNCISTQDINDFSSDESLNFSGNEPFFKRYIWVPMVVVAMMMVAMVVMTMVVMMMNSKVREANNHFNRATAYKKKIEEEGNRVRQKRGQKI